MSPSNEKRGSTKALDMKTPIREANEVDDDSSNVRNWEDLHVDIFLYLCQYFTISELASTVAQVCRTWRLACSDFLRCNTLDMSTMKSDYIQVIQPPYVYVHHSYDESVTRILENSSRLNSGNIVILIFGVNFYLTDTQLRYIAERSPRLKRLILPAWNRLKKGGICKAIQNWKDLESLTMPSINYPEYVIKEIGKNCKKFRELKIMGAYHIGFAQALADYLPNLKILSLRCSILLKDALIHTLDGLMHLEVLNISHCIPVVTSADELEVIPVELDESILEKASRIRKFFMCMEKESCIMCQRSIADEGLIRWYKYEEGLWKKDEVNFLSF